MDLGKRSEAGFPVSPRGGVGDCGAYRGRAVSPFAEDDEVTPDPPSGLGALMGDNGYTGSAVGSTETRAGPGPLHRTWAGADRHPQNVNGSGQPRHR